MARKLTAGAALEEAFKENPVESPADIANLDETHDGATEQRTASEETEDTDVRVASEEDAFTTLQRSYNEMRAEAEQRKKEVETAKAEVDEARRSADNYRRQAEQSTHEVRRASVAAVDSAIAHTKNNITALKTEIARSGRDGDWEAFSEAQDALAQNNIYLSRLTQDKSQIESGRMPSSPPTGGGNEAEEFIKTLSPPSRAWVRAHKDDIFASEGRKQEAQDAHFNAITEGLSIDTPEYFAALNAHMGYSRKAQTEMETKTSTQGTAMARPAGAMPSAPPARVTPGHTSTRNNEVRLTKEQIDTAVSMFSDKSREDAISIYAKEFQKIKAGKTHLMLSSDKYKGGYNGA